MLLQIAQHRCFFVSLPLSYCRPMYQGYNPEDFQNFDSLLDEFIVDYVDGTMDVATRSAFETYLHGHPDLFEQVHRMREIRSMMCGLNCGCMAPPGFQARLRNKLACEMMREELPAHLSAYHAPSFQLIASVLVVLMVFGGLYWSYDQYSKMREAYQGAQVSPSSATLFSNASPPSMKKALPLPVHVYQTSSDFTLKPTSRSQQKAVVRNTLRKTLPPTSSRMAFAIKKPIICPDL